MYYVYKITNIQTGQNYIGVTKNFYNRMKGHKAEALQRNSHYLIHQAIREYGWDNFTKEVIFECEDKVRTYKKLEPTFVEIHSAFYKDGGYNSTRGGAGTKEVKRKPLTKEQKQKISQATKEAMARPEIKEKVSNGLKQMWLDPEYKQKISQQRMGRSSPRKGIKITDPVYLENLSRIQKEKWQNPEYRQHMVEIHINISDETRQKMSNAKKGKSSWNKGITPSQETIQKRLQTLQDKYPDGVPTKPKAETKTVICLNCNNPFVIKHFKKNRFCTKGCATQYRYKK